MLWSSVEWTTYTLRVRARARAQACPRVGYAIPGVSAAVPQVRRGAVPLLLLLLFCC